MNKLDLYTADYNKRSYWLAILISIDQLINTLFFGYPDETLSSRVHREGRENWERVIDTLFWFDTKNNMKHCELSYLGELAGEHFPRELPIETKK